MKKLICFSNSIGHGPDRVRVFRSRRVHDISSLDVTISCNFSIFNQFNSVFFCSANVKRIPLANRHESLRQRRTNSLRSYLLNIPIMLVKLAVRATELFTEASLSY